MTPVRYHPGLILLLALACLLPACAARQQAVAVQIDPAAGAQVQPAATALEKVVTTMPRSADTPAPSPTSPAAETPPPTAAAVGEATYETAMANLRELLGDPQLELAVKELGISPNAANFPAIVLVDPMANEYYVSQDSLRPIEFTIQWSLGGTPDAPKSADQLREIALQLADAHSSKFAAVKDGLAYSEGIKGGNNFFRWEVPGTDVGGMPAILQIGLKQDGRLFSYLNSIDLIP